MLDAPADDAKFKDWYGGHAKKLGLDPNPDAPEHFYDYRAAFQAGAGPGADGHWPSKFKREGHPRMVVDGVNTKTGEKVTPPDGFVLDQPQNTAPEQKGPVSEQLRARVAGPLGRKTAQAASDTLRQMDEGVDYSGVAAPSLRAQYGFLDTPEEKQAFLSEHFGKENVSTDSFGRDVVTINGQKVAFLPRGGKDQGKEGRLGSAWADVASDALPVAGMTAGSVIGAPGGPLGSMTGSGLGGAVGKAGNKLVKQAMGMNRQSSEDTAKDIVMEVPKGAVAQGAAEVLGLAGRSLVRGPFREGSIFGPITKRGKESFGKAQEGVEEARELGLKPKVGTYSPNASFTQRVQNAGFRIFGDDTVGKNRPIIEREAKKLTGGELKNTPQGTESINQTVSGKIDSIVSTAERAASDAEKAASEHLKAAEGAITSTVGIPKGNLGARVAEDIQGARQAFADKASELYAPLDAYAGKPIVPTSGLKAMMQKILGEGPSTAGANPAPVFASDAIKKFAGEIEKLPETITFQQMQVVRSILRDRSAVEALNAGLSERQAARLSSSADSAFDSAANSVTKEAKTGNTFASATDIIQKQAGAQNVENAVRALRRADKFYAAGMKRFNDLQVEAMVKDATRSGFVEPEKVASRIAQPGMGDKLRRIAKVLSPETLGQVGAAKWKQMLSESTSPLTGNVSGRMLADRLKKMGSTLETLYGKEEAGRMASYAEELAALNGEIPANALEKANLSEVVRGAILAKEASNEVMSRGFVNALKSDGPQSLTAAQWLTEPEHRLPMRQAMAAFGPQSMEVKQLKEYLARRIFSSMEVEAKRGAEHHGTTEIMGEPLQKELNRYGRPYLEEVFGKDWTEAAYKLARQAEVATRKNPSDSGGIAAAAVGLHPLRHLGEIARYFTAGELLSTEPMITYLSKGFGGKGMDTIQSAAGVATTAGAAYEAEEMPKRSADRVRGMEEHAKRVFKDVPALR